MTFQLCNSCETKVGCGIRKTCSKPAPTVCSENGNLPETLPDGATFNFEPGDGSITVNPPVQNLVAARAVAEALAPAPAPIAAPGVVLQPAVTKLSADTCFNNGCVESREQRDPCLGVCRQLLREQSVQVETQHPQAGEPASPPQASVAEEAQPSQAEQIRFMMQGRLCVRCKHFKAHLTQPKLNGNCMNPSLPSNLINGEKIFPAMIARGYSELCGPIGKRWEYNGK